MICIFAVPQGGVVVPGVFQPEPGQEPLAESGVVGLAGDVQIAVSISLKSGEAPVVVHNESWDY